MSYTPTRPAQRRYTRSRQLPHARMVAGFEIYRENSESTGSSRRCESDCPAQC